ncbi:extracellular solute-binding protein [Gilvimarinus agarilyticus]|uniref:ABC transporter substrate-binding protein n=1 Tax=Gilvimarinus sp. 2_MG-2023 TaxID=3062666 RepID=UPI001C093631|nr:extracellular solute-binding protein [Gilvimarinus sp. 2_MG-2023]MBU2887729.1 extracellular solute-binding protein [Gilvimarinus agarilyticus]MDO6572376.1 extracellular solute-binding protein [Gilvimarinus sp. 2_MG-2023]
MSKDVIELRGITWNHTRGFVPMAATAQRFEELNPGVRISWDKRSLQAFADEPIDQLAKRYDLLVIDHPWSGFAARTGVTVALDDWLPADFMADQKANSVGHSHESYSFDGKQWALAIDAATPVASARMDLLADLGEKVPETWDELLALAKRGKVLVPSIPQDTLMNFYMLCSTMGEDPCVREDEVVSEEMGIKALKMLRELSVLLPRDCFDWNPIQTYEAMSSTDDYAYCPFAYGYSNYAKAGYAKGLLKFGDMVTLPGTDRCRTTLGGTGLAISGSSPNKEIAARYAQFVANETMQSGQFVEFGGQPGHRKAWLADYPNSTTDNYFKDTLPALDRAFLRPRYHGHMFFQDNSGAPIREYLMNGGDEKQLLTKLNQLYVQSKSQNP